MRLTISPSKAPLLKDQLWRIPLRPASLMEYRILRIKQPMLRLDEFLRESFRVRFFKPLPFVRRGDNLRAYVLKTHMILVQKNIEKLKLRRSELLYCSKRARPIPIHKQLSIFQNPNKSLSKSRLLGKHILNVRGHKLSRFRTFYGFINRFFHKPFTTMMMTLKQSTSQKLQAIALKGRKKRKVLSTRDMIRKKLQSIYPTYFILSSVLSYGEMFFLRFKLQWYRMIQIRAV